MNAEKWLYRGHRIYEEIEWLKNEIEDISARVYSATPNYNGIKVQTSTTNAPENLKIKYIQLRGKYKKHLEKLDRINAEIEEVIFSVSNGTLRMILRSRILKGNRWDVVAKEIHYSVKQTKRLYEKALLEVENILKNRKAPASD